MGQGYRLVPVGLAVVVAVLVVPGPFDFLVLLVLMFVAGCLSADRPVAAATAITAVILLPCSVLLAVVGASWFARDWHGYYPLRFDVAPVTLYAAGDLIVGIFTVWGWAVVAAYMGAGIVLRRRIRAAN